MLNSPTTREGTHELNIENNYKRCLFQGTMVMGFPLQEDRCEGESYIGKKSQKKMCKGVLSPLAIEAEVGDHFGPYFRGNIGLCPSLVQR